jgi:glycine oxidase
MAQSSAIEKTLADVVIIGGGVIGLTVARALAKHGVRHVTVLEKQEFGREASWAAGGILAPQVEADRSDDFFRLACASRDLYRDFAEALQNETGLDVELDATGTLFVAFTEAEAAECRSRYVWQQSAGLEVESLAGNEAGKVEPHLSENVHCALRFPNDMQVDNRRLVHALIVATQNLGVQLMDETHASSIKIENETVIGVQTSRGFICAPVVVLAAGAWSSLIDSPQTVAVEPVRGQMLCFTAPDFAHHVIYSSRGYLIPRRDGRVLAGSTTEHVGFDKRVTDEGLDTIKSNAFEIAPALRNLPLIDSWAGFRPRAKDGWPVLGASNEVAGLFFATGHYRNGILLAPVTGELIAEAIVSETDSSLLKPFSPARFFEKSEQVGHVAVAQARTSETAEF